MLFPTEQKEDEVSSKEDGAKWMLKFGLAFYSTLLFSVPLFKKLMCTLRLQILGRSSVGLKWIFSNFNSINQVHALLCPWSWMGTCFNTILTPENRTGALKRELPVRPLVKRLPDFKNDKLNSCPVRVTVVKLT